MSRKNGKLKAIDNSIFKNCTVIVGDKVIDYADENRSITMSNCKIIIEDENRIKKDEKDGFVLKDYAITLKPIIVKTNNRAAMAEAIVPFATSDDSDGEDEIVFQR